MNWKRFLRIAVKFSVLGLFLSPFFTEPEKMASTIAPFFVAFVLLFMAFGYLPDIVRKPIAKKVKERRRRLNLRRKFWRFMIR